MPRRVTVYRKTVKGKFKKVKTIPAPADDLVPRFRTKKKVQTQTPDLPIV